MNLLKNRVSGVNETDPTCEIVFLDGIQVVAANEGIFIKFVVRVPEQLNEAFPIWFSLPLLV